MKTPSSTGKLATALAAAQAEFEPVQRSAVNETYGSRYADIDAVFSACAKILAKHAIALTQDVVTHDGRDWVRTRLIHESNQSLAAEHPIFPKRQGTAQDFEAAHTYARRIGLAAAIGLPFGQDDDGETAAGRGQAQQRPGQQRRQEPRQTPQLSEEQVAKKVEEFARNIARAATPAALKAIEAYLFKTFGAEHPVTRALEPHFHHRVQQMAEAQAA